jgi:hypothetical protein
MSRFASLDRNALAVVASFLPVFERPALWRVWPEANFGVKQRAEREARIVLLRLIVAEYKHMTRPAWLIRYKPYYCTDFAVNVYKTLRAFFPFRDTPLLLLRQWLRAIRIRRVLDAVLYISRNSMMMMCSFLVIGLPNRFTIEVINDECACRQCRLWLLPTGPVEPLIDGAHITFSTWNQVTAGDLYHMLDPPSAQVAKLPRVRRPAPPQQRLFKRPLPPRLVHRRRW